jgi:hypothetical protein
MDAITHILASQSQRIYFNSESPSSTGALLWQMPSNNPQYGAWADRVMFMVYIAAVGGSPTSWSLGVKFQYEIPHTDMEQYIAPIWSDFDTVSTTSDIFEGVPWGTSKRSGDTGADPNDGGFGVIATEATALPFTIKRTITNFGHGVRIMLDPYAVGGTTPYLNATVLAIASSGG